MSEILLGDVNGQGSITGKFRDGLAYDVLARSPLVLWFTCAAGAMAWHLSSEFARISEFSAAVVLEVAARLAALGFFMLLAAALSLRMRPVARAAGVLPRLVAFCGTFSITALAFFPKVEMSPAMASASLMLMLLGYGLASYTVAHLGRSLSMMAEARRLVTSGPYALLRHPLYAAEAMASLGILLQFLSPAAGMLWAVHIALQFCRMHYEEKVLRQTFPEYQGYALRVARLVPGAY